MLHILTEYPLCNNDYHILQFEGCLQEVLQDDSFSVSKVLAFFNSIVVMKLCLVIFQCDAYTSPSYCQFYMSS